MKHLKANPINPLICPHLALIVRIISSSTYFENIWDSATEDVNFGRHLKSELDNLTEDALLSMGFSVTNHGSHSIRKGANSYGTSIPGFGGMAPLALHAGWKLGGKQAAYTYQTEGGSQNVATLLSGLNPKTTEFATLPMRFKKDSIVPLREILEDYNSYPMQTKILILNLHYSVYKNGRTMVFSHGKM
jgi:hypothetical protein